MHQMQLQWICYTINVVLGELMGVELNQVVSFSTKRSTGNVHLLGVELYLTSFIVVEYFTILGSIVNCQVRVGTWYFNCEERKDVNWRLAVFFCTERISNFRPLVCP